MSKKLILFTLVLCVAALPLMAAESGPSNTVGFHTWDCGLGYTAFAFPFTYYTTDHTVTYNLNNIIGPNQFTGGSFSLQADQIIEINTGLFAWKRISDNTWQGSLTAITPGEAYYALIRSNHPAQTAVTAGEVDMTPMPEVTFSLGYNAFGWREPGTVARENLGIIEAGFTGGSFSLLSDQVIDIESGLFFWANTAGVLQGTLTSIEPTHGYYVKIHQSHQPFDYTYTTPGGGGGGFYLPPVIPEPVKTEKINVPPSGGLQKDFYQAQTAND